MPSFYDRYVLPHLLDLACGSEPIDALRRRVVPEAEGRVLEIGLGTGRNLSRYDPGRVELVIGVDPAGEMFRKAERRAAGLPFPVEMRRLSAEALPLEAGEVDSVVCTFSLCTIPDPAAALTEMRRVLRPGGRLLLAEHGASPDPAVRRWQDRLDRAWGWMSGGCHLNREMDRLVEASGFAWEAIDRGSMRRTPPTHGYYYVGRATSR